MFAYLYRAVITLFASDKYIEGMTSSYKYYVRESASGKTHNLQNVHLPNSVKSLYECQCLLAIYYKERRYV